MTLSDVNITGEAQILDHEGVEVDPWNPKQELVPLDANRVRLSRGFLAVNPAQWFRQFSEHWVPLLHSLDLDLRYLGSRCELFFPDDMEHLSVFELDGESAVIGCSEETLNDLVASVVPAGGTVQGSVLFEYLERRLLSILSSTWNGSEPLNCYYIPENAPEEVDIIGSIELQFELDGKKHSLWIGLGARAVEKADAVSRKLIRQVNIESEKTAFGDEVHTITVELAQLVVPPALLIDYTRAGAKIQLNVPTSSEVQLLLNGTPWALGILRQFHDSLAIEIKKLLPQSSKTTDLASRLVVEMARVELDEASLAEYRRVGAVLVSNANLDGKAVLVFGGERVAEALLGKSGDNFVLTVSPR